MKKQLGFDGSAAKLPTMPDKVEKVCCAACYDAAGEDCDCKCGGTYHGLGHRRYDNDMCIPLGDPEAAAAYKAQYKDTFCLCGFDLAKEPILYYRDHSGGWKVPGEASLCWLYVKCPRCGYDMAIHKLGVSRDFDVTKFCREASRICEYWNVESESCDFSGICEKSVSPDQLAKEESLVYGDRD